MRGSNVWEEPQLPTLQVTLHLLETAWFPHQLDKPGQIISSWHVESPGISTFEFVITKKN